MLHAVSQSRHVCPNLIPWLHQEVRMLGHKPCGLQGVSHLHTAKPMDVFEQHCMVPDIRACYAKGNVFGLKRDPNTCMI